MRDHYRQFSHPVLVDLPAQPRVDLFTEMDEVADELRAHPLFIVSDLQIAFRQLQRLRLPGLSEQEWLDLFALWREHYDARREAKAAALQARLVELWEQRDARPLQERAAVSAEIAQVGREI